MSDLDRGIFLQHPYKSLSDYMSKLLSMQDSLCKASAAEVLRTDTLRSTTKEVYEHAVYLPDTHALVRYRTGSLPTGLHMFWRGPMKVLEGRDSRNKLLDLITLKEKEFRLSVMKPFVFDAALIDPIGVARRDNMEYFIDKILEQRGNLKKKTEIEFLVSWLGYAQEYDSWGPYEALCDSEVLHAYLAEHKLGYLILLEFLK